MSEKNQTIQFFRSNVDAVWKCFSVVMVFFFSSKDMCEKKKKSNDSSYFPTWMLYESVFLLLWWCFFFSSKDKEEMREKIKRYNFFLSNADAVWKCFSVVMVVFFSHQKIKRRCAKKKKRFKLLPMSTPFWAGFCYFICYGWPLIFYKKDVNWIPVPYSANLKRTRA